MPDLFNKPPEDIKPKIHESWLEVLYDEFQKPYFREIKKFLIDEKKAGKLIYPPGPKIFSAFDATPFNKLKVVILGQDPYHGPDQANGMCFSVSPNVPHPKSLINIFKEISNQTGATYPRSGDLTPWAEQGIFLLNAILTVQAHQAASHQHIGWQKFTDTVIQTISKEKNGVIFLLWGRYAQNKEKLIDTEKHIILKSAHPSPLAAHRGFFGNGHFNKVNEILKERGEETINWQLP